MADKTARAPLLKAKRGRWLSYCNPEREYDWVTDKEIAFWNIFEEPVIEESDSDIVVIAQKGDRLDTYANKYYGRRPDLWWVIAQRNNMDWPDTEMVPGLEITIPSPSWVSQKIA
ncbi:MAG: hypothetical protein DRO11_03690 [Methanobacteriota archaeon]|nr:MAG: hypothetical protein DRO11_03690 [Euryarchaeota archaeon]